MPALRRLMLAVFLCAALPLAVRAATLSVPSQYTTIQAGINAAHDGDTVLVADGTYTGPGNVDIDFNGKNITVTSVNGASKTIIDCQGTYSSPHRAFYFHNGETQAVIRGLTMENALEIDQTNGGAICITTGPPGNPTNVTINSCSFLYNSVEYGNGGAISNDASGSFGNVVTLNDCVLSGNSAFQGGAIYNSVGSSILNNCSLSDNLTSGGVGGGIFCFFGSMTLTDCTLDTNSAPDADGGGLSNNQGALTLTGCTFSGNFSTDGEGGGIYSSSDTLILTDCTFTDNECSYSGGAFANTKSATLINCIFNGNKSDGGSLSYGGGYYNSGQTDLTNCAFFGNSVTQGDGGGFYNSTEQAASLTNCVFSGNTSLGGNGGATCNTSGSRLTLNFCTMTANTASGTTSDNVPAQGGGLEDDGTAVLANSILFGNTASSAPQVGFGPYSTSGSITFCDIEGGSAGMGNINAIPQFVRDPNTVVMPPDYGDLHLKIGSPCIGQGITDSSVATDYDGKIRKNPPSLGAYEFAASTHQWTATGIAAGTGGTINLLWDNVNGAASYWNINGSSVTYSPTYGPYAGWTAQAIADAPNGSRRLLWINTNGTASLWTIATNGTVTYSPTYGPFAGWNAVGVTVSPDGLTHLLWTNTNGSASYWNIAANGTVTYSPTFGPYTGWTARSLGAGGDGGMRLLWTNTDGRAGVWTIASTGTINYGTINYGTTYGPFAGWSAKAVGVGTDNVTHLLWDNVDGRASYWNITASGGITYSSTYGPF